MAPLNSAIGYEEAAAVASERQGAQTIRGTVIDRGLIGDELNKRARQRLDMLAMAKVADDALREH